MPRTINPIKQRIVDKAIMQGKSAREALRLAKYAPSTIDQSTVVKSVKIGIKKALTQFDKSKITVDYVLSEFEKAKQLCIKGKKKDMSSYIRANELLGKWLKMFNDNITNIQVNVSENQFNLKDRLKKLKNANTD